MRGRRRSRNLAYLAAGLALVVAVFGASMLIPDYGDNRAVAEPIGPQATSRIEQRNDNAAIAAAAAMRERSARTARVADALQDQQDRADNAAQPERQP